MPKSKKTAGKLKKTLKNEDIKNPQKKGMNNHDKLKIPVIDEELSDNKYLNIDDLMGDKGLNIDTNKEASINENSQLEDNNNNLYAKDNAQEKLIEYGDSSPKNEMASQEMSIDQDDFDQHEDSIAQDKIMLQNESNESNESNVSNVSNVSNESNDSNESNESNVSIKQEALIDQDEAEKEYNSNEIEYYIKEYESSSDIKGNINEQINNNNEKKERELPMGSQMNGDKNNKQTNDKIVQEFSELNDDGKKAAYTSHHNNAFKSSAIKDEVLKARAMTITDVVRGIDYSIRNLNQSFLQQNIDYINTLCIGCDEGTYKSKEMVIEVGDEGKIMTLPLISLLPTNTLTASKVNVEFSVSIKENSLKEYSNTTRGSFDAEIKKKSEGNIESDSIDIKIEYTQAQNPESINRIIEEEIKSLKLKQKNNGK